MFHVSLIFNVAGEKETPLETPDAPATVPNRGGDKLLGIIWHAEKDAKVFGGADLQRHKVPQAFSRLTGFLPPN